MMRTFWRIAPANKDDKALNGRQSITRGVGFVNKLRPGHGLVMADWDEESRLGRCHAFGVVMSVNAPEGSVEATWCPSDALFRPLPAGMRWWRDEKGWFGFATTVVERYMLPALFAEKFPELEKLSYGKVIKADRSQIKSGAMRIEGFVYLIKSPYGYKIGKSVNMKQRVQLFSVKLPFPIEVIHYAKFDDYTVAESTLHRKFQDKRLEGEWFDLAPEDIEYIKSQGHAMDVSGL